ncbi:MAG: hypothetical protein Q8914_13420, partial [Bacteroidota bacterium]|nr:hypothetical protein [Bacteroidota bacterium]
VLFEHTATEGRMHGFSENYIRVEVPYRKEWINRVVSVRLGSFNHDETALAGEPLMTDNAGTVTTLGLSQKEQAN